MIEINVRVDVPDENCYGCKWLEELGGSDFRKCILFDDILDRYEPCFSCQKARKEALKNL